MNKLFLMMLSVFFLVGCCSQPVNAQDESQLGKTLSGSHDLVQVTNGYLMFDDGNVYFTWIDKEGKYINSHLPFNQITMKDTVVDKPFVKFRWTPRSYRYLHDAFNDDAVFYMLLCYDSNKVKNLYNSNIIVIESSEIDDIEPIDNDEYSYEY